MRGDCYTILKLISNASQLISNSAFVVALVWIAMQFNVWRKYNKNAQFFCSKINFRYIFCVHSDMIVKTKKNSENNKTVNDIAE